MNNEKSYYPLAIGNTWTYNFNDQHMINKVESCDNNIFVISNSLNPMIIKMRTDNGEYFGNIMGEDELQLILKDNLAVGDQWQVTFKANGLDCLNIYTVKEIIDSKTVEGVTYHAIAMVEIDCNVVFNNNATSINAFTQCYYAKGVGLILTTTSGVVGITETPLLSYELK